MLEISTMRELNRIKLVESMSSRIKEGKEFVSVYSDNRETVPYEWEIVKVSPNYGYKIVREYSKMFVEGIDVAYTLDNKYIGSEKDAKFYCESMGIKPEYRTSRSTVCSIGKCVYLDETHKFYGKWFGWSHRAIFGFKVGDGYKVKKGDVLEGSFPLGFEASTEEDCKEMAKVYAKKVS